MRKFPRQYLITTEEVSNSKGVIESGSIGDYTIYSSELLPVTTESNSREIGIVGSIFDPKQPTYTNRDIAAKLASHTHLDTLLTELQRYAGRYVIITSNNENTVIIPDASCRRRILYTDDFNTITSSPKLFLHAFRKEHSIDPDVDAFISSREFDTGTRKLLGTATLDSRLSQLLPNHYLNCSKTSVLRRPLTIPDLEDDDASTMIFEILQGTLRAINNRYREVSLGVTAGWDSRLLLAAALYIKDDISFYTFLRLEDIDNSDVKIPVQLSQELDFTHELISSRSLDDEFNKAVENNYIKFRSEGVAESSQYRYYNQNGQNADINGKIGEVIRSYYSIPETTETNPKSLAAIMGYKEEQIVIDAMHNWHPDASKYSDEYGIDLLDLLYWEQKVGNWAARISYEKDIATEELSPFNSIDLLLAGLSTERESRSGPNYQLCQDIISHSDKISTEIPINPCNSKLDEIKQVGNRLAQDYKSVAIAKKIYIQFN